jgi:pyruvate/2-oxoacid:ferredoxin oxidoreductase beta subunit
MHDEGFALVECLSMCPTQWKVTPLQALEWIEEKMIPYYPLGEFAIPKVDSEISALEGTEDNGKKVIKYKSKYLR